MCIERTKISTRDVVTLISNVLARRQHFHQFQLCRTYKPNEGPGSCLPCQSCAQEEYRNGCGGSNSGNCNHCDECPSGKERIGCGGLNPGTCKLCESGWVYSKKILFYYCFLQFVVYNCYNYYNMAIFLSDRKTNNPFVGYNSLICYRLHVLFLNAYYLLSHYYFHNLLIVNVCDCMLKHSLDSIIIYILQNFIVSHWN